MTKRRRMRRALGGLTALLLAAPLLALTPTPATANPDNPEGVPDHHGYYLDDDRFVTDAWPLHQQERWREVFKSSMTVGGPTNNWARVGQGGNEAGFTGNTNWLTSSSRLAPKQEGEFGYRWTTSGDRHNYDRWQYTGHIGARVPLPGGASWESVHSNELLKAYNRGSNGPYIETFADTLKYQLYDACGKSDWRMTMGQWAQVGHYCAGGIYEDEEQDRYMGMRSDIIYGFYDNMTNYIDTDLSRQGTWDYLGYPEYDPELGARFKRNGISDASKWVFAIHLEDENGGLEWARWNTHDWAIGQGDTGGPMNPGPAIRGDGHHSRRNFGSVATVGKMREYIHSEIDRADEEGYGEAYVYGLHRGLVVLDVVYGDKDWHPIEVLMIPGFLDSYACEYYGQDRHGNPAMLPHLPPIHPDPSFRDQRDRVMSCPPTDDEREWEYLYEDEIREETHPTSEVIEAPIHRVVTVEDNSPAGVGRGSFETQQELVKTPLGELLDDLCGQRDGGCTEDTTFTDEEFTALEAAAARSQDTEAGSVDLTASNEQVLADGRLISVEQAVQDVRITRHGVRNRLMRRQRITEFYRDNRANILATNVRYTPWEYANRPEEDMVSGESSFEVGSQRFEQGFQVLVTHCNGAGFDAEVGARSIDERTTNDPQFTGTHLAGTAVSRSYTTPGGGPWGESGPTSERGFYDKVCSYNGTRSNPATEEPASESVRGHSVFPRDGEAHHLPTAYYTPTTEGWVRYEGNGPMAFTATRWGAGTPTVDLFSIRGRDCRTGELGSKLFGGGDGPAPTLRQWTLEQHSANGVAISPGCYKDLFVEGLWASDSGKPQVLTVKWDFEARVATVVPSEALGFNAAGNPSYRRNTVGARVRGQVVSSNEAGRTRVPADQERWEEATGSGTENTLDRTVPYGVSLDARGQWTHQPRHTSPFYYGVEFARAVGH